MVLSSNFRQSPNMDRLQRSVQRDSLSRFVGAVGVEDRVVDQAELEALEDDFGSDHPYGQSGDAGRVVLRGSEGTTAEVVFLDAGPS
jgi:hypothetical protein